MTNNSVQSTENVISVHNLSKKFVIPHERINTLKGAFVNLFRKKSFESFFALDNVSFNIKKGEFFGIVGRNGSGKSTLLKILAGVYTPDQGSVVINGLISPFLELGIGFNPELSGRDNVYLNATVLGLSEKEIDEKYDSIVAFSELERFMDQKIKNYSSCMQVRLAFSVAIHTNRDILIMDEVLAVGDSNFQSKCLSEFNKYKEQGKTVILVTHDIATIQRYCNRALLLRDGRIEKMGGAEEVGTEYMYQNMSDEEKRILEEEKRLEEIENENKIIQEEQVKKASEEERNNIKEVEIKKKEDKKNKVAEITNVVFLNKEGNAKNIFQTGDDISIRTYIKLKQNNIKPNFSLTIHGEANEYIFGINSYIDKANTEKHLTDGYFQIDFPNIALKSDTYYVRTGIFGESEAVNYDLSELIPIKIFSSGGSHGMVKLEYHWK